jgi:rare lipoprotein A
MKKQFWNPLTAVVLVSTIGISGASYAQSSPKVDQQSRDAKSQLSTSPHEPQNNVNKLPAKSPRVVSQSSKESGAYYTEGWASWYGPGFDGNYTASGEIFNQYAMTAAHPYLPFGTLVQVTNMDNGASAVVRINDRGPYAGGRIIDLSAGAAEAIGMIYSGEAYVAVEVLN